jgi:chromosome segregation ATPase
MLKRVGAFVVGVLAFAGLQGCVSVDAYRLKEQQVLSLSSINEDMQLRNKSLKAEKAGLETRVEEMKKENEGLAYWIEILGKDGDVLRLQVEKLNAKIAELDRENQRLALLTRPESLLRTLGDRFADLQKQVEALSGENEKLKNTQVIFRSEDKKAGAESEKTIESAGVKPKAVLVSSEQKAVDSEPQKRQNKREPGAPSKDRVIPFVLP